MKFLFPILLLVLTFSSCAKHNAKKQAKTDKEIILKYIEDHSLTATETDSGLFYVIDNPGTGASCDVNSTVRASYSGYFIDDDIFEESDAAGIQFGLQNVIEGWKEGIPYFKEGGNGTLLLPSALAYGPEGKGPIPANTVLIFDVALLEVY
jgi:FKBP-type peptidyl-prolyl cis-trans isomerase FkpA